MQMNCQEDLINPKYSNFILTQSAAKHLFQKYHESCCFFKAKEINRLILGEKGEKKVLDFKDVLTLAEDIEYLKKYYRAKNEQSRNQLKERMRLLKNYYVTSNMLKYQYPMMVINEMENIFLKRNKLYKKLQREESEEQSESQDESQNSDINFIKEMPEDQEYVVDLSWSQIIAGKFQQENPDDPCSIEKNDLSFEEEEYQVYEDEKQIKRVQFLKKMGIVKQSQATFSFNHSESELNHLVIDFDDLDRHQIIKQYTKLMNKENEGISSSYSIGPSLLTSVFEERKPLSSSIIVQGKNNSDIQHLRDKIQKNKQSMLIDSREERYQQTKVMKRSAFVNYQQPKTKSFNFEEEEFVISEKSGEESPSGLRQKQDYDICFLPKKQVKKESSSQFLTATFGKKQKLNLKQSEIDMIQHEQEEDKWDTAKIKADLLKFKEKPFELGEYIVKFEKDVFSCSKVRPINKWITQRQKEGNNQGEGSSTPSKTLTRVKSVDNLGQASRNLNYTKKTKYR